MWAPGIAIMMMATIEVIAMEERGVEGCRTCFRVQRRARRARDGQLPQIPGSFQIVP